MNSTVAAGPRAQISAHGIRVTLPQRWEGRLYLRDRPDPLGSSHDADGVRTAAHPAAFGHPGESMNPVLHLANFALPPQRGDFGTGAVERMRPDHVFVALLEYDSEEVGSALFAAQGLPRPGLRDFAPSALQRRLPGQLGCQRFFTDSARPFCLYAVLGSRTRAADLVDQLRAVLDRVQVGRR